MNLRLRKGSALLVVLGMVAFVVISAVAFSAYMRYSRAPSSFLRQTIASRMIVKAALAEAICRVDEAIGNNPHPNVGRDRQEYLYENEHRNITVAGTNNYWRGRVLVEKSHDLPDYEDTVSTLTYEGLAYIPPAIVNEARYYSRRTPTAKWRSLDFDVGRYAFCAIDVSDFFDVNIMSTAGMRSSDPGSRITLNYLFDNASQAEQWEELVDQFRECNEDAGTISLAKKVPLISVADLNLAMGQGTYGVFTSPFYRYTANGGNGSIYDGLELEDVKAMTFITDGWFPASSKNNKKYDLMQGIQPFLQFQQPESADYYTITEDSGNANAAASQASLRLHNPGSDCDFIPSVAQAALYDYLDPDHVPLSLSIPTLERVPMVCQMKFSDTRLGQMKVSIVPDQNNNTDDSPTPPQAGVTYTITRTVKYTLNIDLGSPSIDLTAVYPFHHKDGVSDRYTLRSRMGLFFTHSDMGLRPSSVVDGLCFSKGVQPRGDVNSSPQPYVDGVMAFGCVDRSLAFLRLNTENDVIMTQMSEANQSHLSAIGSDLPNRPILEATFTWQAIGVASPGGGPATLSPANFQAAWQQRNQCGMRVSAVSKFDTLDGTGNKLNSPLRAQDDALIANLMSGVSMKLNLAVWAQVVDGNNYTVDMVPACWQDDKLNGSPNPDNPQSQIILNDYFSPVTPLMRFDTGVSFTFKLDDNMDPDTSSGPNWASPMDVEVTPSSVMVADPRFNYAPESWFADPGEWKDKNEAKNYDGDIFMQVSDQAYLQSIYELGNITRFGKSGFRNYGDTRIGHMNRPQNTTSFATSFGDSLNNHLMWRTYDPFGRYDSSGNRQTRSATARQIKNYLGEEEKYYDDGFEALGFTSEGTGFKVNPYTDSTNVLRAVLANTPHDWRCAYIGNDSLSGSDSDHIWREDSSGAKMMDDTIQDFAGRFMEDMRESLTDEVRDDEEEWEVVWRNLGWYNPQWTSSGDSQYLVEDINVNGDECVYNTDRKFLYGYWRDCFAARQQLFLVFVRAEPCMMGGGASGISPPQLGARAVALVWRDPAENPNGPSLPHKTRILFYRQFD